MLDAPFIIRNVLGLHARPSMVLADLVNGHQANVRLSAHEESAPMDGGSIMQLMMLALPFGRVGWMHVDGPETSRVLISTLAQIDCGFEERNDTIGSMLTGWLQFESDYKLLAWESLLLDDESRKRFLCFCLDETLDWVEHDGVLFARKRCGHPERYRSVIYVQDRLLDRLSLCFSLIRHAHLFTDVAEYLLGEYGKHGLVISVSFGSMAGLSEAVARELLVLCRTTSHNVIPFEALARATCKSNKLAGEMAALIGSLDRNQMRLVASTLFRADSAVYRDNDILDLFVSNADWVVRYFLTESLTDLIANDPDLCSILVSKLGEDQHPLVRWRMSRVLESSPALSSVR